jgi:hypothetical protein
MTDKRLWIQTTDRAAFNELQRLVEALVPADAISLDTSPAGPGPSPVHWIVLELGARPDYAIIVEKVARGMVAIGERTGDRIRCEVDDGRPGDRGFFSDQPIRTGLDFLLDRGAFRAA